MSSARSYGDPCAAARALDLIGERWALMIVRELLFGPKRYSDLQSGLPNASPTVLSQRLRDLDAGGVIQRRKLGSPARAWVYELTDWGRQLEPVLVHLGRWGRATSAVQTTMTLGADSLMLALRCHLDPARLGDLHTTLVISLGEDVFTLYIAQGELAVVRDEPSRWHAALRTDPATFKALLIDGIPVTELSDRLSFEGDRTVLDRLLKALG